MYNLYLDFFKKKLLDKLYNIAEWECISIQSKMQGITKPFN